VWLAILLRVVTDNDRDLLHQADPLGLPAVRWLWRDEVGVVLSPLPLCALLGWWAKRRGDRFPVLGVVSGPLLLIAAHSVVFRLPGARIDGDHYSLPSDVAVWTLVAVLGCGAAVLGRFCSVVPGSGAIESSRPRGCSWSPPRCWRLRRS